MYKRQFQAHVNAVFTASYQGDKADGIVWWGADLYWLWLTQQGYTPSHPNYSAAQAAQALFDQEIPDGMQPQAYFDQLHTHMLDVLDDVLDAID